MSGSPADNSGAGGEAGAALAPAAARGSAAAGERPTTAQATTLTVATSVVSVAVTEPSSLVQAVDATASAVAAAEPASVAVATALASSVAVASATIASGVYYMAAALVHPAAAPAPAVASIASLLNSDVDLPATRAAAVASSVAAGVRPFPRLMEVLDLEYGSHQKQRLDLYMPSSAADTQPRGPLPVVIFAHGGGWKTGDRRTPLVGVYGNVGRAFARRGFLTVVISYRLSAILFVDMLPVYFVGGLVVGAIAAAAAFVWTSPALVAACFLGPIAFVLVTHLLWLRNGGGSSLMYPVQIDDLVAAVAWVGANIQHYGGDPRRLAVVGHSSGAHMAMMLALRSGGVGETLLLPLPLPPTQLQMQGNPLLQPSPPVTVRAFVCISGVFSAHLLERGGKFGPPDRWLRRITYMRSVFGLDEKAWPLSFPVEVLQRRLAEGGDEAAKEISGHDLPPLLITNVAVDWGLNAHTALMVPLLRRCGWPVVRVRLTGSDHMGEMLGFDRSGTVGEEILAREIAEWLAARLALPDGGVERAKQKI